MKVEALIFIFTGIFIAIVTPVYYLWSDDPTGTTALVLTFGLLALIGFYLYYTGAKLGPRPEDRKDGEIEDAAGEYGFFSPHSVWPLALASSVAVAVVGVVIGPWLVVIAAALVGMTVAGFVFEYYRGVYDG